MKTSSQAPSGLDNPSNGRPPTSKSLNGSSTATSSAQLTCAALATGMKCLPQNKLAQAKGNVLHDWHAEVLAIRAFNRFLVDECADLAKRRICGGKGGCVGEMAQELWSSERTLVMTTSKDKNTEEDGTESHHTPFELHDDVRIHMYCSEAPCGDASMELVMAEQEDSTPWPQDTETSPEAMPNDMLGRGHFDQLGIVRRKPARPDAPLTLSKSCSDKLAMKQCTSLLSGLTSTLVWPGSAYLSTVVLPESVHVPTAVERAFGATGRMAAVGGTQESWSVHGYAFKPFEVKTTCREFEFSKRSIGDGVPSNLSALVTPQRQEILINGVLQGRKQFYSKGASCASKRRLWEDLMDVARSAGVSEHMPGLEAETYGELKGSGLLEARERVKREVRMEALKGWKRNVGDEQWKIAGS